MTPSRGDTLMKVQKIAAEFTKNTGKTITWNVERVGVVTMTKKVVSFLNNKQGDTNLQHRVTLRDAADIYVISYNFVTQVQLPVCGTSTGHSIDTRISSALANNHRVVQNKRIPVSLFNTRLEMS